VAAVDVDDRAPSLKPKAISAVAHPRLCVETTTAAVLRISFLSFSTDQNYPFPLALCPPLPLKKKNKSKDDDDDDDNDDDDDDGNGDGDKEEAKDSDDDAPIDLPKKKKKKKSKDKSSKKKKRVLSDEEEDEEDDEDVGSKRGRRERGNQFVDLEAVRYYCPRFLAPRCLRVALQVCPSLTPPAH
jgi:hypothetical protein